MCRRGVCFASCRFDCLIVAWKTCKDLGALVINEFLALGVCELDALLTKLVVPVFVEVVAPMVKKLVLMMIKVSALVGNVLLLFVIEQLALIAVKNRVDHFSKILSDCCMRFSFLGLNINEKMKEKKAFFHL